MYRLSTLIASVLIGLGTGTVHAGDPVAGEEKAGACIACHGEQGVGELAQYPILAGQHESYLFHAMRAYQTGERENPVMQAQIDGLSEQDLRDLAAFYSRQDVDGGVFLTPVGHGAALD